jgi:hypothetical protein
VFYLRSVNKGRFLADPSRLDPNADAGDLIDPELSLYAFDTWEEFFRNAVAMRMQASGPFECVVLADSDFAAIGVVPQRKNHRDLKVAEVDERHFEAPVDPAKARILVTRIRARMPERLRIPKGELKKCARRIAALSGWPPVDCWMLT